MTRREAREQAFALLFEKSFHADNSMRELIDMNIEFGTIEDDEFANSLAIQAWDKLEEIDALIEKYAIGWRKNRISRVSLAVLRLAICEMLYREDIPASVSINEAVELCRKYASEDEYSFVNGILGTVSRSLESAGE